MNHETSTHLVSSFLFRLITLFQAKELHIDLKYKRKKIINLDRAYKLLHDDFTAMGSIELHCRACE